MVPTLESSPELQRMQNDLILSCEKIKEITGKSPIELVEFDALTSPMMRRVLEKILKDPLLFSVVYGVPNTIEPDKIYLIGGNFNHTPQDHDQIVYNFTLPLLTKIKNGENAAVFGVGFGSQIALEAYGQVNETPVETKEGALEFGPTPVIFDESVPFIGSDKLSAGCSVVMTHSRYSIINDIEHSGLKPLARYTKVSSPPACEGYGGRLITCQFHPEVELSTQEDRRVLATYLQQHSRKMLNTFLVPNLKNRVEHGRSTSPHTMVNHNINILALNKRGEREAWIARDISMAFMIPQLLKQAQLILASLEVK